MNHIIFDEQTSSESRLAFRIKRLTPPEFGLIFAFLVSSRGLDDALNPQLDIDAQTIFVDSDDSAGVILDLVVETTWKRIGGNIAVSYWEDLISTTFENAEGDQD